MYVVIGIIFIIIGLVMFISPDAAFAITESWKTNSNSELSELYKLRSRISGGIFLIIGVGLMIMQTVPTKEDLILTPSTHKEIQYVQVDSDKFGTKEKIHLALYDPECDCMEVCIAIPKSSDENELIKNMVVYIDGNQVEKYTHIKHTTWWKNYAIVLIEDVKEWNEMRLEYDGYVVEFQYDDIKK